MEKSKTLKMVGLSGALAALVLTGCMSTSSADRSTGRMLDDKTISSQVRKDLDSSPVYKFGDVQVNTYRGVVQLSGFVDMDEQKQKAGEIAKQVPSVREVMNNISLKPREEYRGSAAGERETTYGTQRSAPAPVTPTTPPPPTERIPERNPNP